MYSKFRFSLVFTHPGQSKQPCPHVLQIHSFCRHASSPILLMLSNNQFEISLQATVGDLTNQCHVTLLLPLYQAPCALYHQRHSPAQPPWVHSTCYYHHPHSRPELRFPVSSSRHRHTLRDPVGVAAAGQSLRFPCNWICVWHTNVPHLHHPHDDRWEARKEKVHDGNQPTWARIRTALAVHWAAWASEQVTSPPDATSWYITSRKAWYVYVPVTLADP